MFDTVIDQVKAVRNQTEVVIVKLGTVTALSGGKAQVKLYGDSSASNKLYQYIEGYIPSVNDKVALLPQGKTYIILGKITDAAPVEKYATKDYVDDTFLVKAYANKIQEGDDNNGTSLTLTGTSLLPKANETYILGSSQKQFSAVYSEYFYEDGVRLRADAVLVESGGTTFSLLLTYANSTATLTPSVDNTFALGTAARKFKEAYLGNIRGTWKSGQSTERALSWNSSNALTPDTNESVDLGTSSLHFKDAYLRRMIGALAYSSTSGYISWTSATVLAPSANNSLELGKSGNQFNAVYTNKLYINGTEFAPSGISVDKITATSGGYTRTLTIAAYSNKATILPAQNNTYELGSSTYKFSEIFATKFTGDLNGSILDGSYNLSWDASHNLIPSTTNYLSLGTSSKQYKNVYGQNLYVNGTAVSSDRNLKEEIEGLDERFEEFFKLLKPARYKFKEGTSGRKHTGFIAQEVEEAAHEAGLSDQDIAVVVTDPESGQYYLRYEEIIAVQASVIQNMQKKVDSLEARLAKLEALLERSTK